MKATVYKITSPTGKIYVGSTNNIKRRLGEYSKLKIPSQYKLLASLKKYGFNAHSIEILWEGDVIERFNKEAEYGVKFSVLDRIKGMNLKLPKKGEVFISYSEETLLRMRQARKGKSALWNNELVSIYTLQGVYIKTFNSCIECARELNTTREIVGSITSGRTKTFKNIYLISKGGKKNIINLPESRKLRADKGKSKNKNKRRIMCIEDNLLFTSVSEAAKHYKISLTSISNILYGRAKKTRNGKSFYSI